MHRPARQRSASPACRSCRRRRYDGCNGERGPSMTTLLFAGGGTGGHVYPMIAVADAVREIAPELRLVFVGTERGMETRIVPERGYQLELLNVLPIRGAGVSGALRGIARAA